MDQVADISTKEQFIQVASTLLDKNTSNFERERADEILAKLYKSINAWPICKQILEDPSHYEAILFTAAKMLRVKMFYYFNELPESEYLELFNFLISKL
jgi:hypothetical protein